MSEGYLVWAILGAIILGVRLWAGELGSLNRQDARTGPRRRPARTRWQRLERVAGKLTNGRVVALGGVGVRVEGSMAGRDVRISTTRDYNPRRPLRLWASLRGELHLHAERDPARPGRFHLREVFLPFDLEQRMASVSSDPGVRLLLEQLFRDGVDEVQVADGWVQASLPDDGYSSLQTSKLVALLRRLTQLARTCEATGLPSIRAVEKAGEGPRLCPYCRDDCLGDDGLVACARCGTVHHEECFAELRECTSLGCTSTASRPFVPAPIPGQQSLRVAFDLGACETCGQRWKGCSEERCLGTEAERRHESQRRAHQRRKIRLRRPRQRG